MVRLTRKRTLGNTDQVQSSNELAATYAALILADEGIEITVSWRFTLSFHLSLTETGTNTLPPLQYVADFCTGREN